MGLKLGLACAGGGHLNEMVQLESVYSKYEHFFYTMEVGLAKTLTKKHKVYFTKDPVRNPFLNIFNFYQSLGVFLKEMPDVIITTGGGVSLPMCVIGKCMGRKVIYIETFSRVFKPSMMGRIVSKFADLTIIQWEELKKYMPKAVYGGPLFNLDIKRDKSEGNGIVVVVGTFPKSLDRLFKKLDELVAKGVIKEKIVAQIGNPKYIPKNFEWIREIPFEELQQMIKNARIVVTHAGVGSILNCLELGKVCIAVARLKKHNEVIDDHQVEIAKVFGDMGLVIPVLEIDELESALEKARNFTLNETKIKGNVQEIVGKYLTKLVENHKK